jgi:hypothetical protein
MRRIDMMIITSTLLAGPLFSLGIGFDLGPFDLEFGAAPSGYVAERGIRLDNPLCFAIDHQKRVALIMELKETLNSKEMKIVTKKLVVDPYAFGFTREKKPILRGNVVGEKELKQVTIKYADDEFDDAQASKAGQNWFTGWFTSKEKLSTIDISKVISIEIIDDSYFTVPDNLSTTFKDEIYEVVCQVHSIEKQK